MCGFVAGILLSQLWDTAVLIENSEVSLPLFVLFFIVGACSSASNVTHFTLVSQFDAVNTSALAAGMGVGSMVSGLLAILQGTLADRSSFSVDSYYITLSLLYIPAVAALWLIDSPSGSGSGGSGMFPGDHPSDVEVALVPDFKHCSPALARLSSDSGSAAEHRQASREQSLLLTAPTSKVSDEAVERAYSEADFLREHYPLLCVQLFNASLGYGLVPAMVSLACAKFNNRTLVLLLATGITAMVDPLCKAATAYARIETLGGLQLSSLCLALLTASLVLCIVLPSSLPLFSGAGGVLPVSLYVSFGALFGFSNTCVFRYFKQNVPASCMGHSYRWGGIATQSGALVGSLISFAVIVTNTLK